MGSLLLSTSSNTSSSSITTTMLEEEALSVRSLIAQLCEQYYKFGWATGTGGGVSIRVGGPSENRPWRVFVAPSGIQKEDMIGDDVFELDMDRNVVHRPKTDGLKLSACTPLWYCVFKHRPSAMSVIHTHSMNAQMATLLDPTEESTTLKITHLEMLKGVGGHAFDDILEIPIIDNRPSEDLLAAQLEVALEKYPNCNCVLVRRHGLYVWGDSWEQAKTQAESFDYLFESAIAMKKLGVNPSVIPPRGTYHDLKLNTIPILPRDYKHLLLDIEGCTTAISFVKDVLFPYVVEHVDKYIETKLSSEEQTTLLQSLRNDLKPEQLKDIDDDNNPATIVKYMVKNDLKVASLKSMQGGMWKDGYKNGSLKGHVYDDFVPMLDWMTSSSNDVKVYIYSSGSVQAQKLLFGNSIKGDLTKYFTGHFDITTSGNKKQKESYTKICKDLGIPPSELVFCSDSEAELIAANEAGIGKVVMTIRPGNAPLSLSKHEHPQVFSLLQLCGGN
ncbi:2,3-diketo-5-methylthio-1-phosphopentane phosphatase [Fragilariopsis cylindrus CCMP1102]|uniref:2,3-diketo-5-methylthio-1-phosphopentane phosphatase n=1 Tax=Fragilariopsis cylindrus CCMP1102 TaxID=635003 RepID=A0A1E7FZA9_9STRA|nr:2,3-diketo-5-methylthio-1-phosphopentane phosphatase [Fragilariopsis cylindrus CCMP1102]|eukprot:OEU23143.1 2,3-diketo-5-methylthio-1-phosphopentane phosphatase [Fragilariopsis cylindrus CCMP1102]